MKLRITVVLVFLFTLQVHAQTKDSRVPSRKKQGLGAEIPETPHLEFATKYVRELAALDRLHTSSEENLKQDTADGIFLNAIYDCTRMQLELRLQIAMLQDMRLNPPFEKLISTLTNAYTTEIDLLQQLIKISKTMVGGSKSGVDYAKQGVEIPKIRAKIEYIDHGLFEIVPPTVFLTLVDQKGDSQNHVNHLIITRAERAQLLDEINTDFGAKLSEKNPSFQVGAAVILREALLREDFKSSDDPWE